MPSRPFAPTATLRAARSKRRSVAKIRRQPAPSSRRLASSCGDSTPRPCAGRRSHGRLSPRRPGRLTPIARATRPTNLNPSHPHCPSGLPCRPRRPVTEQASMMRAWRGTGFRDRRRVRPSRRQNPMSKTHLYAWAHAQKQLKPTEKAALLWFVQLADGDRRFWLLNSAVEKHLNLKRRRVQTIVLRLKEAGLIENTGLWRRRNGTHNPIYQLAGLDESPQDTVHPATPPERQNLHGAGRAPAHPLLESKGDKESSIELSSGQASFQAALQRHPESGRAHTNVAVAEPLWASAVGMHGAEKMDAAHSRWTEQYNSKPNEKGAPGLHTWLNQRRHEGFLPKEPKTILEPVASLEPIVTGVPTHLLAAFRRKYPRTYDSLARCCWRASDRTLIANTTLDADDLLSNAPDFLHDHHLRIEDPAL